MKHLLYTLIGISCLVACTSSPDSHFPRYSDFAKTKALSAQVINLDTILLRLCQNAGTTFFYAQSPDFHKPGLCYYPKFLYL